MQDSQPAEALCDLDGGHRRAVVAHGGARQAALLHGLHEAVDDVLGRLVQIPLEMAGQTRTVIEDAEQQRRPPFALGRQHLARAVMEIPVPQAVDVLGLVAAHLARLQSGLRRQRAGRLPGTPRPVLDQVVGAQEAAHRRIGRRGPELGALRDQGDQVVVVKLGAPALVRGILGKQRLAQGVAHRRLAAGVPAALAA